MDPAKKYLSLLTLYMLVAGCSGEEALKQAAGEDSPQRRAVTDVATGLDTGVPQAPDVAQGSSDTGAREKDAAEPPQDIETISFDTGRDAHDAPGPDLPPEEEPEVKFVAMGDTGKANEGQVLVAKAVEEKCLKDGCDFVLLLGDNIYDSGVDSVQDPQWQKKFEVPYADLDLVFRPALGNHDNGSLVVFGIPITNLGGGAGMEFGRGDIQVDYSAYSEKWDMPARYYDWTQASAHFFALDTNSMMFEQHADQAVDMVNRITQSAATWKIAYGHHPYVSNGKHGNAGSYDLPDWLQGIGGAKLLDMIVGAGVKAGLETIVCPTGVDIYLSGHDHNRQWIPGPASCPGVQFVVSGAGASTTDFVKDQTTLFQDDQMMGFVWIHIKGNSLHAEFIDTTGTVNFVHDLQK
jgi:tartrate-resistant acid phosphatase type 5